MRLSKITVDHAKSRRADDPDVSDLLQSLPDVGLLHPILVFPSDETGHHELLAGHRRLLAACQLGWEEIPARVVTLDGQCAELAALAENLVRKPFSPSEELRAIAVPRRSTKTCTRRRGAAEHGGFHMAKMAI